MTGTRFCWLSTWSYRQKFWRRTRRTVGCALCNFSWCLERILVHRIAIWLERGQSFGAIPIDFSTSDAVDQILSYEPLGVQWVVDCVGMEAVDENGNPDQGLVTRIMVRVAAQNGALG